MVCRSFLFHPFNLCIGRPHLGIVPVMAPLAESRQIQKTARFRPVVVNVRGCQDYFRAGYWVRFVISGPAPLASVLGAIKSDKPASELPVCRVSASIFWLNRHLVFLEPFQFYNQFFSKRLNRGKL